MIFNLKSFENFKCSLVSNPISSSSRNQIEQFFVIESENWKITNDFEAPKAK